jgi:serine/threonine protein kinase
MSIGSDKPRSDGQETPAAQSPDQIDATDFELPENLEVIRMVGQGSMATVFLARDTVLKRLVAIKLLRRELSIDPTCRRRFEREAQAAARLSHDCVTAVYSVGQLESDDPYIVMEYVDGNNLADILNAHGPFSIDETISLLVQISSGLAAAHEHNIIHRDVKPANVLIDNKTGQATLTDFGVAAILETGSEALTRLTRIDERFGDPRYMSPEQLRGETLTGQSDIYGLGIIGYELLTGKGPFDDPEIGNIVNAQLRRPPPELNQLRVDVPQTLSDTLKRCLAKSPEHRPRAQDLPRLLQDPIDLSVGEGPSGPVSEFLQELKQRNVYRAAVAYAAVSFLILQVADLVLPALTDSDTLYQVTVITCLAGFPPAIVLAWIFDLRNGRLIRTEDDDSALSRSATPFQRLLLKLMGLGLSITLVVLIARWLLAT